MTYRTEIRQRSLHLATTTQKEYPYRQLDLKQLYLTDPHYMLRSEQDRNILPEEPIPIMNRSDPGDALT